MHDHPNIYIYIYVCVVFITKKKALCIGFFSHSLMWWCIATQKLIRR